MANSQNKDKQTYRRSRDGHRLDNPANLKTDKKPELYLEKVPSAELNAREFEEMVPEFMHRDFYRSQEGDLDAVEPSGDFRSLSKKRSVPKPKKDNVPLEPLRTDPEPERDQEPSLDETVAVPLEPVRAQAPPQPRDEEVTPTRSKLEPVQSTALNLPLLACLLLVVALFVWREQTRPGTTRTAQLPLPAPAVQPQAQPQPQPDARLQQESPYPAMSDDETEPLVESEPEPEVTVEEPGSVVPTPISEPVVSEEPATPPVQSPARAESLEVRERAAQRAAILERVSDGTVSRSDSSTRFEELEQPAAPKPQEQTQPGEATQKQPWIVPDAAVADTKPKPVEKPEPPKVKPATPPTQAPGEPYQIAEPKL